jgi:hypothetical protein
VKLNNRYLFLLFFFCLLQVNWVAKRIILPREFGSEWAGKGFSQSFDIYRLLPTVTYMQTRAAQELAQKIARQQNVQGVFESLDESIFKNEVRRQYFLLHEGETLDNAPISFSVEELLKFNFFDEAIAQAKNNGILDLSEFKIGRLQGLADLLGQIPNIITELNLSHNELYEIWYDDFANYLSRVTKIDLSYNHIQYIEPKSFDHLSELKFLDLGNNQISDLPSYVFSQLYKLEDLDLSDNNLKEFKAYMFFGLTSLKRLNLADNPGAARVSKQSLGLPQFETLNLEK